MNNETYRHVIKFIMVDRRRQQPYLAIYIDIVTQLLDALAIIIVKRSIACIKFRPFAVDDAVLLAEGINCLLLAAASYTSKPEMIREGSEGRSKNETSDDDVKEL